jgi:hypothetical protein
VHGAMRTLAALVGLERSDQVFGTLAVQLWHRVRGVHVLVVRNGMAAIAGIGQCPTTLSVASLCLGMNRERRGEQQH